MTALTNRPPARVGFSDLGQQWQAMRSDLMPALESLFATSQFCLGPAVECFEEEFSRYLGGSVQTVGVNSGTSALHLALLVAGVGPGDEVLVPTHTFIATAWAVVYVGATPVFCDVEEATGTIDVSDAEARITSRTKAIIPVHLYGQAADMSSVQALADRNGLAVIEDAAQAHGALLDRRSLGTIGLVGCFSFYPGKNLGAAGEAGAAVTAVPELAERMRALRNHGQTERYVHAEIGYNYRMEGIQGLVLSHKLRRLTEWTESRRRLAAFYEQALSDLPLVLPREMRGRHVYHLYVVRTPHRDALRSYLSERGIETGLHYPIPLHRQPCFSGTRCNAGGFRQADLWAERGVSLPLHPGIAPDQAALVVSEIRAFFGGMS